MMKRKLLAVFCGIIVLALLVTGSYAYFTREDTAQNVITTGNIDFEINEVTDKGERFPVKGIQVLPGDTVSKIVTAKNTGSHPLYLRIKLTKGVDDISLSAEEQMSMNINTSEWTYNSGYYYYNKALEKGEETAPLFTEVYIDGPSTGNEFIGAAFTLNVSGEAVQSENNGDSALEAAGWPTADKD